MEIEIENLAPRPPPLPVPGMDGVTLADIHALCDTLLNYDHVQKINKLARYKPYEYQIKCHNAEGFQTPGRPAAQRLLMAANKIGKTMSCAFEVAMHATGRYPDWFKGTRYHFAPAILVCGLTNESVRDIIQKELFGEPMALESMGTGAVPKDCLTKPRMKPGMQGAFDSVRIKHISGGDSRIYLRAYEQGWRKFMGIQFNVVWADEEPDQDVWSQLLRSTIAMRQSIVLCSMTPEQGQTEVVTQFLNRLQPGQAIINATWDDAPHLTEERKKQILAAFPAHERDMRSKGIPMVGRGLVFPMKHERMVIEPIEIPRHWPRIIGIDFGFDHPFAACALALDREADTVYLTNEYKESHALPPIHVQAIKAWGDWVPVSWPHDGLNTEKGTGEPLADSYRKGRLNMLPWRATNPPQPGQREGEGGNSVEASLIDMYAKMEQGQFKVFSTCQEWLKEVRMYHRDERMKIVAINDDLISASRYAYMMLRHARTPSVMPRKKTVSRGITNWKRA